MEVTEEILKTTTAWEGKLNNFFLKSKDVARNRTHATTPAGAKTAQDMGSQDQQLLGALDKARTDLDAALCDSFNTPVAMRILSDLVTEFNSVKGLSDETVLSVARWITRIVTIFGLDAEGDLTNPDRVGWSGLDIPISAQPYIYLVSQLRDRIRQLARSGSLDHAAVAQVAEDANVPASQATLVESSNPYEQVLEQFRKDVKRLTVEKASAKDLLTLCDQLRDTYLWNLGIYIEDREPPLPALVRPVDRSLLEAREEKELAATAKREAKLKREAEAAEERRLWGEKAKISPLQMFRTKEYTEWDENGIPLKDTTGEVAKSRRKKLVKEWERQKKMHEEWLTTQSA